MQTRPISRLVLVLVLGALLLAACGTLEVNVEPTAESTAAQPGEATETPGVTQAVPIETAISIATNTPAAKETPTPQPVASTDWRELRDPGTGFGFALPCWWITYMPDGEATNYAITVASYDEPYFMANSAKGQWLGGQRPQGAYKMDFYVDKQIDPSLTDEEAVRQALTSEENTVELLQARTVGRHSALLAIQGNVNNPDAKGTLYAFRLSPTSLMMVSAVQASDFTDPLVQAILNSLALAKDEAVELPTIEAGPALIAKPAACQP